MEVIKIQKTYGKKQVLKEISFEIKRGTCTGIIGANGCGKSTLFRILSGGEKADGGEILIEGRPYRYGKDNLTGIVGYIPQENALIEELSVKDNIALFASLSRKKPETEYVKSLCNHFSVTDFYKERVDRLSGGMKKRVAIVCALINRPRILIMDEPSAALDLVFKEELGHYIKLFTAQGGSVLISSHDRGEIEACDTLYAIVDGVTVLADKAFSVDEMIERYMKTKGKESV